MGIRRRHWRRVVMRHVAARLDQREHSLLVWIEPKQNEDENSGSEITLRPDGTTQVVLHNVRAYRRAVTAEVEFDVEGLPTDSVIQDRFGQEIADDVADAAIYRALEDLRMACHILTDAARVHDAARPAGPSDEAPSRHSGDLGALLASADEQQVRSALRHLSPQALLDLWCLAGGVAERAWEAVLAERIREHPAYARMRAAPADAVFWAADGKRGLFWDGKGVRLTSRDGRTLGSLDVEDDPPGNRCAQCAV